MKLRWINYKGVSSFSASVLGPPTPASKATTEESDAG
jgi:hypothetical protein